MRKSIISPTKKVFRGMHIGKASGISSYTRRYRRTQKFLGEKLLWLSIFFILVFLTACQSYNFNSAFHKIQELDRKYNTSLYTEALDVENVFSDTRIYDFDWNRTIIKPEYIDKYIQELILLRDNVQDSVTEDKEAILIFIDARINMLNSEGLYSKGLDIGDSGNSDKGFRCSDKSLILNLSHYYNESSIIGQNATALIDKILTHYPITRDLLSGEKRPKFYDSPFWPIRKFAIRNKSTIEQLCDKR